MGRTIDLYPDFSCLLLLTLRVIETFSMMQLSIWLWMALKLQLCKIRFNKSYLSKSRKVWEYWQWYLQETRLPVSKLAVILISLAFLLITHLHIYVQSGYIQYTQPAHLHSNHQSIINNLSWTLLMHLVLQINRTQ